MQKRKNKKENNNQNVTHDQFLISLIIINHSNNEVQKELQKKGNLEKLRRRYLI